MKRLRGLLVPCWLAAMVCFLPAAQANPGAIPGTNAGAVPQLSPQSGQWLVCVASYTGPEAQDLANQLGTWIRSKSNNPVYVFNRADEARKAYNEEFVKTGQKKMVRVEDQYAILVGGYNDLDTASTARDVIRKWPLPELKSASGKSAYDVENFYTTDEFGKQKATSRPVNPFVSALPIRNPLAPKAAQQAPADPLLKTLNDGEEYSIYGNPKPWTLAVKQYSGASVVTDQPNALNVWEKLFGTNKQGEALEAAGRQAHELARVLRKLGFQAWVFHTRTSSVVSVGGFDRVDDPEMDVMRSRLTQMSKSVIESNAQKQDIFGLFPRAMPMEVPRAK